jgi:hypothetical protein
MANVTVFGYLEETELMLGPEDWVNCQRVSAGAELKDCELAILPFGNLFSGFRDELRQVEQLESRIYLALERGTTVCLLYSLVYMPSDFDSFGDYRSHSEVALGERILQRENIWVEQITRTNDLSAPAKKLEEFVREYAATEYSFSYTGAAHQFAHIVCKTKEASPKVCGFALQKGKGLLYVMPGEPARDSEEPFIKTLVACLLDDIRERQRPEGAPIAASFQFTKEKEIRAEKQAIEANLKKIDTTIATYRERKDILYLRDDPLANRLPEWLRMYLGFKTNRIEEYIEDFWIIDDKEAKLAICEAKGLSKNVKREHITALVQHREHHELADDFPSILFVNTFADAETAEEKDKQRITKIECKKAVNNHVLIVRTLDLVRLLDLLEQGKIESPTITQLLLSETGWLKVSGEAYEVVKE